MSKKRAFTLIELLVVIAIIALLMSILMPALARAKKQAMAVVGLSRLHQWGVILSIYTSDNDSKFHGREVATATGYARIWLYVYEPLYKDKEMLYCPTARNPGRKTGPFGTWNVDFGEWQPDDPEYTGPNPPYMGSYGMNRYVPDMKGGFASNPAYWRRVDVKGGDRVPVLIDCQYVAFWPGAESTPPAYDGDYTNEMHFVCINRHLGNVNAVFMDFSARPVGLKELWTLKYSRDFDTCGSWTTCGGVKPRDWPEWMRNFKNY